MNNTSTCISQMQGSSLSPTDQSTFENTPNFKQVSISSNLPSLVNIRNKNDHFRSNRMKKMKKYTIGKSDLDTIISADIKFCSINPESSDISYHTYLSSYPLNLKENILKVSKKFDSNRPNEFISLFTEKCNQCALIIDSYNLLTNSNDTINLSQENRQKIIENLERDKENKKELLTQLIQSLQFPILARKITSKEIQLCVDLFSKNIFRLYPAVRSFPHSILFDRIESFRDEAWDQISDIYTFFISLVTTPHIETKYLIHPISVSFVKKLFLCLASPDDRERKSVISMLYSISCRLPERSILIFHFIKNILIDSISGEPNFCGISQVLELLSKMMISSPQFLASLRNNQIFDSSSSLFDAANQNLSEAATARKLEKMLEDGTKSVSPRNTITILEQIFLSLHHLSNFPSFSSNLYTCIGIYLKNQNNEKSTNFLDKYILYLLSHYPAASQKKQITFLNEMQQIVSDFSEYILSDTAVKLMKFIGKNLFNSPCIDISDMSMSLIFDKDFSVLVSQYYSQVLPVFYVSARKVSKTHYDHYIRGLAMSVLQELSRIDRKLFNIIIEDMHHNLEKQKHKQNEETGPNIYSNRHASWALIKEAAAIKTNDLDTRSNIIPSTSHIFSYNNENGNNNADLTTKKEDLSFKPHSPDHKCSGSNRNKCFKLNHQSSSQSNANPSLLNSNIRQRNIESSRKTNDNGVVEFNFNRGSNFKQIQIMRNQPEQENEQKIINQPVPAAIIKGNRTSRSPRLKSREIVKLNNNLRKKRK